jgi:putative hydrolase of the HAD superfamily/pyrimidine and pyridine-specific 5'-nucleotidase
VQVYELVISAVGGEPTTTLFCDDSTRNIASAHDLGILTVLVGKEGHHSGADACISQFAQLPQVLPQLFQQQEEAQAQAQHAERRASESGVAIRVPA